MLHEIGFAVGALEADEARKCPTAQTATGTSPSLSDAVHRFSD